MGIDIHPIDSPQSMSAAIRQAGIIPFVRNTVPGWSIEELTAPGYWFWDDVPEIALRMEMSESAVKTRLSRTMKKLRQKLNENGYV